MNVDKFIPNKLRKIFVYKKTNINIKSTHYPQNENICNYLKINKLKLILGSYNHTHTTYLKY
jgi:hypothetical protein